MQGDGRASREGGVLIGADGHRGIRADARSCAAAALVLILGWGCAGAPAKARETQAIPRDHPRAALLPLENLTAAADAGEAMSRIVWTELARSGAVELIDPGNVDAALDSMQIRAAASITSDQLRALGDTLGVGYVFSGSVLESGRVSTPEGDVPSVGLTLRMVETKSARVVWAGMRFRSGEDQETVFGWGRVRSAERLAEDAVAELLKDFRDVGGASR